jgi:RNA polymerase sigma factor (sigma-70 family)
VGTRATARVGSKARQWEGLLVSDYRVKISVSNARIRRAMEAAGYPSVLQMCREKNLPIGATFDLINMKASPLNQKGEWRKCVLQLCDALYALPNDLFSERQKVLVLTTSTGTKDVTESELVGLAGGELWSDRLEDMRDNAGIREIAQEETENVLNKAMAAVLTPRERMVLSERFGLNGEVRSLDDIGLDLGLSRERIRQLESKAIGKLKAHVSKETNIGKTMEDLLANINDESN